MQQKNREISEVRDKTLEKNIGNNLKVKQNFPKSFTSTFDSSTRLEQIRNVSLIQQYWETTVLIIEKNLIIPRKQL